MSTETTQKEDPRTRGKVAAILGSFTASLVDMIARQPGNAGPPDPIPEPKPRPLSAPFCFGSNPGAQHRAEYDCGRCKWESTCLAPSPNAQAEALNATLRNMGVLDTHEPATPRRLGVLFEPSDYAAEALRHAEAFRAPGMNELLRFSIPCPHCSAFVPLDSRALAAGIWRTAYGNQPPGVYRYTWPVALGSYVQQSAGLALTESFSAPAPSPLPVVITSAAESAADEPAPECFGDAGQQREAHGDSKCDFCPHIARCFEASYPLPLRA